MNKDFFQFLVSKYQIFFLNLRDYYMQINKTN